jgi:hypothetical protein
MCILPFINLRMGFRLLYFTHKLALILLKHSDDLRVPVVGLFYPPSCFHSIFPRIHLHTAFYCDRHLPIVRCHRFKRALPSIILLAAHSSFPQQQHLSLSYLNFVFPPTTPLLTTSASCHRLAPSSSALLASQTLQHLFADLDSSSSSFYLLR